jgi:hypothetical protein
MAARSPVGPLWGVMMSDERLPTLFKNLGGTSDQRKPVELDEVLLGILHRLDDGTSERKAANDRLVAIENEMKRRGPRGGFAGYLLALCIGVAAYIAWQSYGQATKQIIAAKAPELGWSPEAKEMIASWVQHLRTPAGSESTAVQPSVQETRVASAAETPPVKVSATPSIDPEQVHQIARDLATLRQTVDQLAASQDQMVHQIDVLQSSNQEILASNQAILAKIPAPPPPPPTVSPARKPTTGTPPLSRAPTPRPYP